MKLFLIAITLLTASCQTINSNLQNAIAFGVIEDLNKLNPEIEKQLLLRLYRSPVYREECFKETHGVCQYNYYLSVSTFDEYPETNIYELKTKGEITEITWLDATEIDSARLNITFNRYTSHALKNNGDLSKQPNSVQLEVSTKKISEVFNSK